MDPDTGQTDTEAPAAGDNSTAESLYGQQENQQENQPENQPENQQENQQENQPENQPENQQENQQENQPEALFENLTVGENDQQISQQDFDGLKEMLGEAGYSLDQDTAQKLVDFEQDRMRAMQKAQQDAHNEQISDWQKQAKEDPELGGEKFQENLTAAQEALGELATPELREVLEQTGLGNHPEIIRLFHKLSPLVREESPGTPSNKNSSPEQSRLERLYG